SDGVWLHNLLWSGVNAGGMMELFWTGAPTQSHIMGDNHDHRPMFATYFNFIKDVPLNNGRYTNAAPTSSTPNIRAWGQQDIEAGHAHLWIQNANHTWWNLAQGNEISPISGTITLSNFQPGTSYTVTWWDTYQTDTSQAIVNTETVTTANDGLLVIEIEGLEGDTAVKITESP
ncbi:MAG: hypothetical protein GY943_16485, partial [Chloroflexi bacterium]|nr:hypothetical protein [Chloroflexota bacterium]